MSTKLNIAIEPVTYADIPTIAKLSADAFITDRHTRVKQLGRKPYDMAAITTSNLLRNLGIRRCVYIKAVDTSTSEILGACGWGSRGVDESLVPRQDPGPMVEVEGASGEEMEMGREKEEGREGESIDRLCAMEDADMKHWQEVLMPESTQCMYIMQFSIAPKAHGQGVGSALMKWGTDVADRLGVFIWVHSSEEAWKFYEKFGFEVVGQLDLDLDEWAPRPPEKEESESAKWGRYVLRYMKRLAKRT